MTDINHDIKDDFAKGSTKSVSLLQCLSDCQSGAELEVVRVQAGRGAKQRLANLGIFPGSRIIKTKSAPFRGPVEVIIKNSKIVLGRGLAAKVIVRCNNRCK